MEVFTILLSSLLALVSPAGFIVERLAADAIRDRLVKVETLAVRVDNAPSYQLAQGKVDRVRIAGRGIYPVAGVRIAALELETDPIAVEAARLRQGQPQLKQPLNAGVRLVLTEADLNQALRSPQITQQLRSLSLNVLGASAQQLERYDFVEPQVSFLENRIRFQVTLQSQPSQSSPSQLSPSQSSPSQSSPFQSSPSSTSPQTTAAKIAIVAESGLQVNQGRQLQLLDPSISIDGKPLPPQLIALLVGGISQKLDLANLEARGITTRILQWQLDSQQLSLAAFVRIEPQFQSEPQP